ELNQWVREDLYSSFSQDWRDFIWEKYRFGTYESATSLVWLTKNNPQLQESLLGFSSPLGEHHLLYFGFFINEKSRNGLDPDPAWVERRWEMAYKILDTVEITPRPGKF
ncbi:MAG: hypothetical protein KJN78_03505, partial [Gammaproteobacteria bacterium]|nr:hypothetical protein [Gammaproteobacteria bacterium]